MRPVRATVKTNGMFRAALTGRVIRNFLIPRAMPWAVEELPLRGALGDLSCSVLGLCFWVCVFEFCF